MATKVKGQRTNNGEYQEFYDVDAIHELTDSLGNKYGISLNEQGDVVAVKKESAPAQADLVSDGLIHRWIVVDGVLTDTVTGNTVSSGVTYDGSKFKGVRLGSESAQVGSVEVVGSRVSNPGTNGCMFVTTSVSSNVWVGARCWTEANAKAQATPEKAILIYWSPAYSKFSNPYNSPANFYERKRVPRLNSFNYANELSNYLPCADDKYTSSLCFDLRESGENNKKLAINGIAYHNDNTEWNITSENGATVTSMNTLYYYEVRVYDRVLTDEELEQNAIFDKTHWSTLGDWTASRSFDGYEEFGANPALRSHNCGQSNIPALTEKTLGMHTDESGNEYTISALTPYTEPDRTDGGVFDGVQFIDKPDKLYTFRKYSVVAYPHPYYGDMIGSEANNFHVMYSSSDESVCSCIDGVLIPKAAGEVTITARLAGTQLTDSFTATVEVYDDSIPEEETLYLPKNFAVGIHMLNSKNPKSCALAMFYAIKTAGESGYRKIVFPQMDYHIYPVFDYGNATSRFCVEMPSNLQVDFSGSNVYIAENPYCFVASSVKGYTLFKFTNGVEYSAIKNAHFFGERYKNTTHAETEYYEQCKVISLSNCYMCSVENVILESCVGFQFAFHSEGIADHYGGIFDPNWTVNSGLANKGLVRYEELEFGDYDTDGNPIEANDHIRTKVLMRIGYTTEALQKFQVGLTMWTYFLFNSRWVRVWWYDENQNLLNPGGTEYFQYTQHNLPEGAAYFKLSAANTALPDHNAGDGPAGGKGPSYGVLRIFPIKQAYHCWAKNVVSVDTGEWGLTITGGQQNYFGDMVLAVGKRYGYWSINLEDNAWTIHSNVFDNIVGVGFRVGGGFGQSVLSYFGNGNNYALDVNSDCECFRAMNCTVKTLRRGSKSDALYRGIKAKSIKEGTIRGRLIETNIETGIEMKDY